MQNQANRYKVFTGVYLPDGRWDERPGLMSYKDAANYAAKIARKSPDERIHVWDMNQQAVLSTGFDSVSYTSEMGMDQEWSYIAVAILNAIREAKTEA